MHLVALGILALVAGFIYRGIVPKVEGMVPAKLQEGPVFPALVTGAFILGTIALASFVMGFFPAKFRAKVPTV